jgi:hypothetical protein
MHAIQTHVPSPTHPGTRIAVLLGMSFFIFWACAPMMSAPPSPPMRSAEFGEINHGVNAGIFDDNGLGKDNPGLPVPMVNYQFALRRALNGQNTDEFGTLIQVGWPSIVSGGGYYRKKFLGGENTYIGGQASLGLLWAGVGLPMAFKVSDKMWFTTHPAIRGAMFHFVHLPLGLSWELGEYNRLDTEVGGMIMGKKDGDLASGYAGYVGVNFSQQLGKRKRKNAAASTQ